MKRRLTAAALAAATTVSLAMVPAEAATKPNNEAEEVRQAVEAVKLLGIIADKGTGAAPNTEPVGNMMAGSIKAGSSGEEAYRATQAGWALTWIAISVAGLGLIGYGAKAAGILPPQVAAALPF
ncbi:hypothetical protein HMPREF2785_00310 [Corynebacterium sp. HMSC067D03]|uniref:hypothetical protein n=1 Tax=unclassified Corynebacterium TaxID=2624378 RepID=UPI0008A47A19|nr:MULTISPECIES: hypothetical protein [unclassified Corynebacterium]OFL18522.1 hypothetical protein HMPREF2785_00310 [Corynebacterium sp. HMSC067D03]OFL93707.1 hypothetical protein HMPREF2734_00675 [Corynebacterium sp. HMSC055D05]OHO82739.1 hypothetical protein HMPREF2736_03410 [Corynebacterium sp. HMSC036E10]